ncbi:hypothetical protein [Streptomyces sp. NPDC053726]|uniref:hypothetical protein n=1 Tax=Streptomyces sp. NPDC053726 TaxID=3365713 RepID=UPI0037D5B6E3
MASTRNNRVQNRRAALREQQKREQKAADAVFTLLDKEEQAREASADGVAKLVDVVGKPRAADLLGLTPAEVAAYITLYRELSGTDETGEADSTASDDSDADTTDESAEASIPAQSEADTAPAAPAIA